MEQRRSSTLAQATGGRADPDCIGGSRRRRRPTAQAAIDDTHGRQRPRRDHRADQRPGVGDRPGQRRSAATSRRSSARRARRRSPATPAITVPAGHVGPLPIGVSFIGGRWSEPELIGFAYDFEQATHVRVKPDVPWPTRRGPLRHRQRASSVGQSARP